MANSTSNVTVGKPRITGSVFYGAAGSTLPTSADGTISSTVFSDLGYVSEDGVTEDSKRESETIKDWGGDTVASPQTSYEHTFKFTLIESLNVEVLKAYYGDTNVSGTLATGITINANSKELPEACWIIDQVNTGGVLSRFCIPKGKITETGEISYKAKEAVGLEITITAFPDTSGNCVYKYIKQAGEESE